MSLRMGNITIFPHGAFLHDLGALLVADLHIGYEEVLLESGIHLPRSQYGKIKLAILEALERFDPDLLVLLGDVKHEFGVATRQEWVEVLDLMRSLKGSVDVQVVRGNHDNFLIPILRREDIPLHDPGVEMGRYYLVHGHKPLEALPERAEAVIMGHEHPAIGLRDELGVKRKFKCALLGGLDDVKILVLPAISPLAPGTDILSAPRSGLLSPILSRLDLGRFEVIATDSEAGVVRMGTVSQLRRVQGIPADL
ncbi:MAG: metallophosphoesterase [Candidatus Korarchaeota archaeon]|nr:metallophosphoesterase [Candidatus Korarchaeota archaeon]